MDCIKNHKQGAEILTDYCAGVAKQPHSGCTADAGLAAEVDAHIQHCAECRALVEAQSSVWEMLDAWTPMEVSRDFDSRVYARIASEQSAPAWRRWWSRMVQPPTPYSWWKPMASLAVAGAIVSMAMFVRPPEAPAPVQTKSTTVQSVAQVSGKATSNSSGAGTEEIDLQQVQQALDDLDVVAPAGQTAASPL